MNTADYVTRLLDLGRRAGKLPTYGSAEWEALPPADPRRFASVVRAAEAWRTEGTDEAIKQHIKEELAAVELATLWGVHDTGIDVHDAYTTPRRAS
jgi:hypothetical protein